MKKIFLTLITLVMTGIAALAQDNQVNVDIQFRARGEYVNGYKALRYKGESPKLVGNERARLGIGYQYKNVLELKVSGQHTGLWNSDGAKGHASLNEAWAKVNFGKGWFAQVGRMQLAYDDERILGASDWKPSATWHDALRFGYDGNINKLHLIFALDQKGEKNWGKFYAGSMPYKSMQAMWYHYQSSQDPVGVSALFMNVGREAIDGTNKTKYMQTFGTDINYTPAPWSYHFAMYFQTGKTIDNLKQSAIMLVGGIGYQIDSAWGVNIGYDYLGGSDGEKNISQVFDALYATNHKYYGLMDYFPGRLESGLQDYHAGITSKAIKNVSMQLDYHYLLAAHEIKDFRRLGHEVDLQMNAQLCKDISLAAGYSMMFATHTMELITGGSHRSWQDWGWLSLNINPRIFSHKW